MLHAISHTFTHNDINNINFYYDLKKENNLAKNKFLIYFWVKNYILNNIFLDPCLFSKTFSSDK